METEDVTERKSSVNVMRYRFHIIRDLCEMFNESITERGHPDMISALEGEVGYGKACIGREVA